MTYRYLMTRLAKGGDHLKHVRTPVMLGTLDDVGMLAEHNILETMTEEEREDMEDSRDVRSMRFINVCWPPAPDHDTRAPLVIEEVDQDKQGMLRSFFSAGFFPSMRHLADNQRLKDEASEIRADHIRETSTFRAFFLAHPISNLTPEEAETLPPIQDITSNDMLCQRVANLIVSSYASSKPQFWHYGAARTYLAKVGVEKEVEEDAVLALGASLGRACMTLARVLRELHRGHAGPQPDIHMESDEGIAPDLLEQAHTDRAQRQREAMEEWNRKIDGEVIENIDGMLAYDAALCGVLEDLGADTSAPKQSARERFEKHPERGFDAWRWWFTPAGEEHKDGAGRLRAPFVEYLLWALWPGIKEQLGSTHQPGQKVEDERNGKITTMPHVLTEAMMNILSPRNEVSVSADQMHAQIVTPEGEQVAGPAKAATPFIESILQTNIEALRSAHGMRLLIWIVQTIHEQYARAVRTGHDNRIIIEGGLNALRENLGITSAKASPILRAALDAGPMWQPIGLNGQGLWTWVEIPSKRGKSGTIHIDVGTILTPDGLWLHKGQSKLLTPIVDLAGMVGRRNDHAAVGRFQFALVHDLSRGSKQLPEYGGVLLTQDMLEYRAMQAGLPESTIAKAIDRWTQDGDDAPALLEKVEEERFHLADNDVYGPARTFLDEQGGMREERSKSGKRGGKRGKKGWK